MKKLNAILVLLISSLTITGLSFIDDQIWNTVFVIVGLVAYGIVGIMFSLCVLSTSKQGKEAYAFVSFLLLLGGYGVYKGLIAFDNWVLSWPIFVKIMVPTFILVLIGVVVFLMVRKKKKEKPTSNQKP